MKLFPWESIIQVWRPHKIGWVFLIILGVCYIVFLLWIFFLFRDFWYIYLTLISLFASWVVLWYMIFLNFILKTVVLTNQRIIYVEKKNIFQYQYRAIYLSEIIQVKAILPWFFPQKFWYGTLVFILNDKKIVCDYIPDVLQKAKNMIELLRK